MSEMLGSLVNAELSLLGVAVEQSPSCGIGAGEPDAPAQGARPPGYDVHVDGYRGIAGRGTADWSVHR